MRRGTPTFERRDVRLTAQATVVIAGAHLRVLSKVGVVCLALTWAIAAGASAVPLTEQAKLTGPTTGPGMELGPGQLGASVSLSADGNTALVGGYTDGHRDDTGAAWVFTRAGGGWTEQQKLTAPSTGPDSEIGLSFFGMSVALSADGNTALVGGPSDNKNTGAAWVFTRAGGVWTERQRLIAPTTGKDKWLPPRNPQFGISVALSSDGSTALIGGYTERNFNGAAWVFNRTGSSWTERQKLTAPNTGTTRGINRPFFGYSVALSSTGNVALIGGYRDDSFNGAAWVLRRSAGVFTVRQKLLAPSTGAQKRIGAPTFGFSAALAADGNTAVVGGPSDRPSGGNGFGIGAAWVFTRTGQQLTHPHKLIAPAAHIGAAVFGYSVALSGVGDTAVVGVPDEGPYGAAWAFARAGRSWPAHQLKLPASGPDKPIGTGTLYGTSVALNHNGSTALVGDLSDNMGLGAAWVFGGLVSG